MSLKTTTATLQEQGPRDVSYVVAHFFFAIVVFLSILAAYGFTQSDDNSNKKNKNEEGNGTGMVLETMAFYGVYHSDPMNQLIHFIFVPCIVWSTMIIMAHLPILEAVPPLLLQVPNLPGIPTHSFTWATLTFLFYTVFYSTIDPIGCFFYFPFLYTMYATAVRLYQADQKLVEKNSLPSSWTGTGRLIRRAWMLHVLGWYMQIHPGHKIFEGSQPAVLQSLGGALTSAPLFAFYEAVWAMGIRQELKRKVMLRVQELRYDLCTQGVQMRLCQTHLLDASQPVARNEL